MVQNYRTEVAYEMYERYFKGYSKFYDVFDARYKAKDICLMICNENINNNNNKQSIEFWEEVLNNINNI